MILDWSSHTGLDPVDGVGHFIQVLLLFLFLLKIREKAIRNEGRLAPGISFARVSFTKELGPLFRVHV